MFKKITVQTTTDRCTRYAYGRPAPEPGSWLILGADEWGFPYKYKESQFEKIISVEDLDDLGELYCFYNFPVHNEPTRYIEFDHLFECVNYIKRVNPNPLVTLLRLFRVQLGLSLHGSKLLAESCLDKIDLDRLKLEYQSLLLREAL